MMGKITSARQKTLSGRATSWCARISLVFLAGEIPVLERVKPAHQESSLGLMEATT